MRACRICPWTSFGFAPASIIHVGQDVRGERHVAFSGGFLRVDAELQDRRTQAAVENVAVTDRSAGMNTSQTHCIIRLRALLRPTSHPELLPRPEDSIVIRDRK